MNEKEYKIIILHSHLRPGGVSRIISSQVKALTALGIKVEILTGEEPRDLTTYKVPVTVFPELNYLVKDEAKERTGKALKQELLKIESFLEKYLLDDCIIHVHNLNLGKNPLVSLAVKKLAEKGLKVFNHAHDFAEDRAENFEFLEDIIEVIFNEDLNSVLYPELDNYRFGVLNRLDFNRLMDMGVPENKVSFLPNPVAEPDFKPDPEARDEVCREFRISPNKMLFVYPVRAIRRKNIGELILLAHLFRKQAEFVVTLPPQNPVERVPYEKWLDFCNRNIIRNIHFEAGTIFGFEQIMNATDKCITSSIKEGFGMMFLEPWLFNKAVVGRNIEYVTSDFLDSGLKYSCLYSAIKISFEDYETSDFGFLPQEEQMTCLEMILDNRTLGKQVFEDNPCLRKLIKPVNDADIKHNKKIIKKEYSLEKYGTKLNEIYAGYY